MNWLGLGLGLAGGVLAERVARSRAGLGQMPAIAEVQRDERMADQYLDLTDGGRLHYLDSEPDGSRDGTIVLLHGVTLNADIWHHQFALSSAHRVISIDLRAHGQSVAGSAGMGIPENAADLVTLLDALDLRRSVLIGHSMGGMTIGRFIADHEATWRKRVAGIGFVSSAGRQPKHVPRPVVNPLLAPLRALTDRIPALADRIGDVPANDLGEAMVRASFGSTPRPEDLRLTIDAFEAMEVDAFLEIVPSILEHNVLDALVACPLPASIIVGSRDNLTPPRESRALERALPNATLEIVPGGGHQLMLERPDEVTAMIAELAARSVSRAVAS